MLRNTFAALVAVWALAGCALLSATDSPANMVAASYKLVETVNLDTASRVTARTITADEGAAIQTITRQALDVTTLAEHSLAAGDVATADGQARMALAILDALEARLK